MSSPANILRSLIDDLYADPKYKKSTTEIVVLFNTRMPDHVRFAKSTQRTSLDNLQKLGGIYKSYHKSGKYIIELFLNLNQVLGLTDKKWATALVNAIQSNKDINTFNQQKAAVRKELLKDYSDEKPTTTYIEDKFNADPKLKELVLRSKLHNYFDDETSGRRLLSIIDYWDDALKNKDLVISNLSNFNAISDYSGTYKIVGDKVLLRKTELDRHFKDKFGFLPDYTEAGGQIEFHYPSQKEFQKLGIDLNKIGTGMKKTSDDDDQYYHHTSSTPQDNTPADYGFKGTKQQADALTRVLGELLHAMRAAGVLKKGDDKLVEEIKDVIYNSLDSIKSGAVPDLSGIRSEAAVKFMKRYFAEPRYYKKATAKIGAADQIDRILRDIMFRNQEHAFKVPGSADSATLIEIFNVLKKDYRKFLTSGQLNHPTFNQPEWKGFYVAIKAKLEELVRSK